jgi:simple sugar transport system permease protein
LKKVFKQNEIYVFFIFIALCILITSFNRSFFTLETLFSLLTGHAFEGILALGFFVALLSGGIDVSFAAVAITSAYIGCLLMIETGIDKVIVGLLISMVVGIIMGAINGILIGYFKLPTLIVTLGTLTFYWGALTSFLQTFVGKTIITTTMLPSSVIEFGKADIFQFTTKDGTVIGFPLSGAIFIGLAVLTWVILKYTTLGRSIKAIGGSMEAAHRSGFKITYIQVFIYSYIGFLASIAGFMHIAYFRVASPLYMIGTEITIIAMVVIGGASITGGKGSVIGTVLGVAILTVIRTSLVLMKVPTYFQQFVIGLLIVVSVTVTALREQRKARASRVLDVE